MIYQTIQNTDVPALGFGTWKLMGSECRQAVEHALAIGYRHIDTARVYRNEPEVGQALQNSAVPREDIFLTSKVWHSDLMPREVRRSVERSLSDLQTDHLDLLLIHWPNPSIPLKDTLDAFRDLQNEGKARRIGVSNFTPSLLQEALDYAPIFCNQVEYHPYLAQDTLLAMAREHDMLLTAYSPIARGRVLRDPVIREIGRKYGKNPVQITLRWLVQQENVAAIPKAASPQHRIANFDIFEFSLSDEEMARIAAQDRNRRLGDPDWAPAWER